MQPTMRASIDGVRRGRSDTTAIIQLDRPGARNAIDPAMAVALESAVRGAESDPAVRVIVLAGGPPVFCAGADLKAIDAGRIAELSTTHGGFGGITRLSRRKPLIAAVDGPALAGGAELALACDLIVASASATFGLPEVKRGLIAAGGGLFRLARALPERLALQHALTGEPIDAETAHRHGLVGQVTAAGAALDGALELAARIAANAPLAVVESRAVLQAGARASDAEAWRRSEHGATVVAGSEDVVEGVRAFIEKRPPVWRGR